jgi:hypothetical protein
VPIVVATLRITLAPASEESSPAVARSGRATVVDDGHMRGIG